MCVCIHIDDCTHVCVCVYIEMTTRCEMSVCTANPTWGDIFECCFKAQSSNLERLFSLKRGKRDVRALSFELSKMSPQVALAVYTHICMRVYI